MKTLPRPKTVLLVEDNPDDVDLLMSAFEETEFPYPVEVARDGTEAVDFLFSTGKHAEKHARERPSVVILDLKMPKLSGMEVLKRFRLYRSLERVVVIVLTSSAEAGDRRAAMAAGANMYMQKPIGYQDLVKVAGRIKHVVDSASKARP